MATLGKLKKGQNFRLNLKSKLYYSLSDVRVIRGKKYRAYARVNSETFKKYWLPINRSVIIVYSSWI